MARFLQKHVGLLMFVALVVGILLQPVAAFLNPYITYYIVLLIALGCVKLDLKLLVLECKQNWLYQLYMLLLRLVVVPLVLYYFVIFCSNYLFAVPKNFAVGALLLYGMAVGASAPALVLALKGNFERAALNMVLSSLFMVVTFPILLHGLVGDGIHVPLIAMFYSLFIVIVPPTVVGFCFKVFLPKLERAIEPHIPTVSIILLILLILGCPLGLKDQIMNYWHHALFACILVMISSIFATLLGWFLAFRPKVSDRLSLGVVLCFANVGLSILLAHSWYAQSPFVILYVSMGVIPFCAMPLLIQLWLRVVGHAL